MTSLVVVGSCPLLLNQSMKEQGRLGLAEDCTVPKPSGSDQGPEGPRLMMGALVSGPMEAAEEGIRLSSEVIARIEHARGGGGREGTSALLRGH